MERINYQTNEENLGNGIMKQTSGLGVINYKDSKGDFQEIDLTLIDRGDFWSMEKSIYNIRIPKYADKWFEFKNVFEKNNHTIKSRPVANHILGVLENNVITYTDAFGDGIDMEVSIFNDIFSRKVIIRKPQTKELNIDFEFDIPQELSLEDKDNIGLKNNVALDSSLKGKRILFNGEQGSFISPMKEWDKEKNVDFIEAKFFEENGKRYLRKTIDKQFLQKAVYPVSADDNTGATSPGTMANDTAVGTRAWVNPDNAKASDNVYATINWEVISNYLKATNFGFTIPSGATINGILVEIERKSGNNITLKDSEVKIVKADGTIGATNKALADNWSATEAYFSYGAIDDLWGETWDDTKINDIDFGVVLSTTCSYDDGDRGFVDHIRITVYYTVGGATPTDKFFLMF